MAAAGCAIIWAEATASFRKVMAFCGADELGCLWGEWKGLGHCGTGAFFFKKCNRIQSLTHPGDSGQKGLTQQGDSAHLSVTRQSMCA